MAHDKGSQEFGSLLFTDADMQNVCQGQRTETSAIVIRTASQSDLDIANEVAHAMKEWARKSYSLHTVQPPEHSRSTTAYDSSGNSTILMLLQEKSWYRAT